MSYNPHITAARRAAKQIARENGASYQSMLDEAARRAGRADWNAFLADPAPLPIDASCDAAGYQILDASASGRPSKRMAAMLIALAAAVVMPATAAIALWQDAATVRGALDDRSLENRSAPRPDAPSVSGIEKYPTYVTRIGRDHRDLLVSVTDLRGETGTLRDRVMIGMDRMLGRTTGYSYYQDDPNMLLYEEAHRTHLVSRMHMTLNCRTGMLQLQDVQAADDYVSPAKVSVTPAKWQKASDIRVEPDELRELCSDEILFQSKELLQATTISHSKMSR